MPGLFAADGVVTVAELLAMITCFGELDDPLVAAATPLERRRTLLKEHEVAAWAELNRAALLSYWNDGLGWTEEEHDAFLDGLRKLP